MSSEHIGFRCPDDLVAAIKSQAVETGRDKTTVIVEMLKGALPSLSLNDRGKLPIESAVYFVWQGERVLYVGKTSNLRQRFNSHHRLLQFLGAGEGVRVAWFPASKENLAAFETSLIEEFKPELNGENIPDPKYPQFSFRIEEDLFNRVETYCKMNSLSKTDFARKAFEMMLGKGSSNAVTLEQFENLARKVEQFESLTSKFEEFESLARKVEQLSSKLAPMGEIAA